jgi:hypothetical protein
VERWSFEPARRAGAPIDAGMNLKVVFILHTPASGARPQFVERYRNLLKAIEANDRPGADEELVKLDAENLYEDAFKNLGNLNYHRQWGTEAEQLRDLRRVIAFESTPRYLPKDVFRSVLYSEFRLELKLQEFGAALQSWKTLRPLISKADAMAIQKEIDQVELLRKSDQSFRIAGQMDTGTRWQTVLLKNRFQIMVSSGHLSEIKLRCEKSYLFFRYEPGLEYKVEAHNGSCCMELIGEPGTRFDLVQS